MVRSTFLILGLAALLVALVAAPAGARPHRLKRCGTISFSHTTTHLLVIRKTKCRTARRVARRYDAFRSTGRWHCALGHNGSTYHGHTVGFVCGKGGRRGSLERFRHAFIGSV